MQDKMTSLMKKTRVMLVVLLICALLICACSGSRAGTEITFSEEESVSLSGQNSLSTEEKSDTGETSGEMEDLIYVHVCGAVNAPGVYELCAGDRVIRAIEAAGGFTKDADEVAINQAGRLEDGQQIYVYTKEESEKQNIVTDASYGSDDFSEGESKKININTAGKEELMTLTGIGEAKAKAIVDYREVNGSFQSVEDLMEIDGIKEGVFRKIRDDITV